MNAFFRITLTGAGLVSLVSCGPTIRSDRDESIPVPQGATWAWATADTLTRAARGPSPVSEIVRQRFQRAIEATMLAKGYRQVADASQADFVLSARFGEPAEGAPARRTAAVAVGFSTGWGYRPWGFGRFGLYRPWGFYEPWGLYQPWGWGFYGAPVWGGFVPAYGGAGQRVYSDRALVVVLRHRPTGYVAWSGRVGSDAFASHRLTQDRVQEITTKLFESLR
jgi:hypothetical protein